MNQMFPVAASPPHPTPATVNITERSYLSSITQTSGQTIFVDGLRLILQFLSLHDFKSTGVFRICRHWWRACASMKSLGLRDRWPWPNMKQYDMTQRMYPPNILESPSLGYHCPQSVLELHWTGDASEVESMLNQLTTNCSGIEVLRVNTYDHSDVPHLLCQLLKFRQLKTLAVKGHSLHSLLTSHTRLPDTLRRIEWTSTRPLLDDTVAFGLPHKLDARLRLPTTILPRVEEFRQCGSFRPLGGSASVNKTEVLGTINADTLFQYSRYLPNLTNLEATPITADCLPILERFKQLRHLSFGLCGRKGARVMLTPKILNDHRPIFSRLTRLELDLHAGYVVPYQEDDGLQWQSFFSGLPELTHLILSNVVEDALSLILPHVHHAPRLTSLTINPDNIRPTWKFLSQLILCEQLIELNIWPKCTETPLQLIYDQPIHYRHELLGRTLWPNLERFYLDYTLYIFPPLGSMDVSTDHLQITPPVLSSIQEAMILDYQHLAADPTLDPVTAARRTARLAELKACTNEWNDRLVADARTRHLAGGFSAESCPTVPPPLFISPVYIATDLASHNFVEEAHRHLRSLVGQPFFIEDDEWSALVKSNSLTALQLLVEFHYRPTLNCHCTAIAGVFDRYRYEEMDQLLPIVRSLLELTTACGDGYARAVGELVGERMCWRVYDRCHNLYEFKASARDYETSQCYDLASADELIRLMTSWYTRCAGKMYVYPHPKQLRESHAGAVATMVKFLPRI